MAENNIYNVGRWVNDAKYLQNNIAYDATTFEVGSVPKNIRYYYSLKNGNENKALPVYKDEWWGGYISINGKQTPEFLWTSSYNASINHAPRTTVLSFGNGYEQRLPAGLFSTPITFAASFEMRNEAEATAILHFLKSRKGVESFTIKNLPSIYGDVGLNKLFVCPSFSSNLVFFDNYTIKATFNQTNH